MELWFTEKQTKDMAISCRVTETLYSSRSAYQKIAVYNTAQFGPMLSLDDVIQTTVKDEFVYHEMISHVAMNTHPAPRRVLVIGGGDGGTIREIIKHNSVERAVLAEIDSEVITAAKKFMPSLSSALDDPKVEIMVGDGIEHVIKNRGTYDVIIVDSTDPVGPAEGLFSSSFYSSVCEALRDDGLFVAQTESPFFNDELIPRVFSAISAIFPVTRLFLANVPTYPGGLWSFTIGSKKHDPLAVEKKSIPDLNTRYYSPDIHFSCFVLPPFVSELVDSRNK